MSETATVELLTAEVRVLMVGSRQITLSVSRQLDRVPWRKCEPFGRIRDSQDYHEKTVIGKHSETGALVRSNLAGRPQWLTSDDDQLKHNRRLLSDRIDKKEKYQRMMAAAERPDLEEAYRKEISLAEVEANKIRGLVAEQEGFRAILPDLQKAYDDDLATFNALPLIVLAGLK